MEAKVDGLKNEMKASIYDRQLEDHINNKQKVLQILKDNLTLVQNQMK